MLLQQVQPPLPLNLQMSPGYEVDETNFGNLNYSSG